MASGSFISVTPGSGAKLATGPTYTENANTVQDEKVILGEQYLATYTVATQGNSTVTANSHLLQVMAGASLKVRVRRIEITQWTAATAANLLAIVLLRLTSAGTGGVPITPSPLDTADAASGAAAQTLPTAKGTEGTIIAYARPYVIQTIGVSSTLAQPIAVWDFDRPRSKPLIIPAGAANGIAIKNLVADAACQLAINIWLDETSF